MSWADKLGKKSPPSASAPKSSNDDVKIVEEENNVPFAFIDSIRIGSAHAVERNGDREALKQLLQKYISLADPFDSAESGSEHNHIRFEDK